MWGSNCLDYLLESYRILEDNGILLIIESNKRWPDSKLQSNCENSGFTT